MVRRGAPRAASAPALLQRAGAALGVPATQSRSSACARSSPPAPPSAARERSAELRGLLAEIAREHGINRALMRQELAFLVAPDAPDRPGRPSPATARRRRRRHARRHRAARPPRARPPGLSSCRSPPSTASRRRCAACSPSSGCSTPPATTSPTRRPPATRARRRSLSASPALRDPGRRLAGGAGAHLGSGVDVQAFRRVRDQLPRPPVPRAEHATSASGRRAPTALDQAPSSRSPSRATTASTRSSRQLLGRLVGPLQRARRPGRQAGASSSRRRAGRRVPLRPRADARASPAPGAVRRRTRGPPAPERRGRPDRDRAREPERRRSARHHASATCPNDLLDRRDQLLDQLSELRPDLGRPTSATARSTSPSSTAVDRDHLPDRDRRDRDLGRPARRRLVARRPARRPARRRQVPGGTLDGYLTTLDSVANQLASHGQQRATARRSSTSAPPAARDASHVVRRDPRRADDARRRHRRRRLQRPRARGLAAARQRDHRRRLPGVRRAGRRRRQRGHSASRPTPRCSPTPSRTAARASSGVSLDEEMSNLVRFQRAYQASARAMSTMDEMLDVLINRTGRVGL